MHQEILDLNISANGKLLSKTTASQLEAGDIVKLQINGHQLLQGADKHSLLGDLQDHLPQSKKLELTHIEPLPDGCCQLKYIVCD